MLSWLLPSFARCMRAMWSKPPTLNSWNKRLPSFMLGRSPVGDHRRWDSYSPWCFVQQKDLALWSSPLPSWNKLTGHLAPNCGDITDHSASASSPRLARAYSTRIPAVSRSLAMACSLSNGCMQTAQRTVNSAQQSRACSFATDTRWSNRNSIYTPFLNCLQTKLGTLKEVAYTMTSPIRSSGSTPSSSGGTAP